MKGYYFIYENERLTGRARGAISPRPDAMEAKQQMEPKKEKIVIQDTIMELLRRKKELPERWIISVFSLKSGWNNTRIEQIINNLIDSGFAKREHKDDGAIIVYARELFKDDKTLITDMLSQLKKDVKS